MAFNFDDIELQGSAADDIDYTLEALKAMMNAGYPSHKHTGLIGSVRRNEKTGVLCINCKLDGSPVDLNVLYTLLYKPKIISLPDKIVVEPYNAAQFFPHICQHVHEHYNRYTKAFCALNPGKRPLTELQLLLKILEVMSSKIICTLCGPSPRSFVLNGRSEYLCTDRGLLPIINKKEKMIKFINYIASQPANKFNIVLMEDCLCNLWRNCAKLGIPIPSEGYKAKTVTLKSFCNLQAKLIKAGRHSKKHHSKGKEA